MITRYDVPVEVLSLSSLSLTLEEFLVEFNKAKDSIPAEFVSTATVEVESSIHYECAASEFKIVYRRPETDGELARRQADADRQVQSERDRELRTLQLLEKKYRNK